MHTYLCAQMTLFPNLRTQLTCQLPNSDAVAEQPLRHALVNKRYPLLCLHNAGVAGSSPAVATSFFNDLAIILKKNHI